ncbi:hypothetical protein G8O24_21970 [Bradyrhizobium sp. INPA01-394B]|jgi:hypothetical protein|uniref:Uncharacterized protein n=2 Tax=Bradyrhizobium TaxID=374 RepID=A0ABR7U030_9BRAD|nr:MULTISPECIES: hypothetical protein [Bradyrhizobium]MBC9880005.1 hypothetical protein [Bradyrhizobium campsiandrae]MBC9977363.1 hypothetical protein [Bradyrhizobium campsiandrae]MBR1090552.1 hypothetical protein [Bradyrhizobium manausense]MDU1491314.1 hypothetical protein [Bradyrhizobium sp.]MDU1541492.1 hypothetical protein [Bradyrhizobium sp.]
MADRRALFRKDVTKVKRDATSESRQLMNRLKQMTPAQFVRLPAKTLARLTAAQYREVVGTIAPEIRLPAPSPPAKPERETLGWRERWRLLPSSAQMTAVTSVLTTAIVMMAIASPQVWRWTLTHIEIVRPGERGNWPRCTRLSPYTDGCLYFPTHDMDWNAVAAQLRMPRQQLYDDNKHLPPQFIPARAPIAVWRHRGRLVE